MAEKIHPRAAIDPALLEEDLSDLYENGPCGYLSTLPDGTIIKVNGTFLRWTGYERDVLISTKRFVDLLTAGGRIFYETHLRPLLHMQGRVREIALDVICRDGRPLPVLINATELIRNSAAIVRITVLDATERRSYERELLTARNAAQRAAQAKDDLIAMISHDVRSPLNAILTAVTLLEQTSLTSQQSRYTGVLRSSASQAVALLTNILDLSRLEAGRALLRETEFDVRELVNEAVASVSVTAHQKPGLTISTLVQEGTPDRLIGDRSKIGQILTNLLTNAVKFTERGFVSLIVYTRQESTEAVTLEFIVSDSGMGIPADRLPYIFDEFTQASDEIAQKYGGTGLGLAICQKLLRLYGSELHATSTFGQGSSFSFVLQLKRS